MVQRESEAKVSISDKSHEDNLPAETEAAEMDVSKSEVQALEETEKENDATLVGCSKVDKNTTDASENEYIHEEHAAEEAEMEVGEAKGEEALDYGDFNGGGSDDDFNGGGSDDDFNGGGSDDDYNDDDVDANDDDSANDDFDEGEEELGDSDEDNGDDVDDEDADDDNDNVDDVDDDENDYMMEEEEEEVEEEEEEEIDEIRKLENNDYTVEESHESQRNRVAQGKKVDHAKEDNEEREVGSLRKKEKTLRKAKERKKVIKEVSDKVASEHKHKEEEDGQGDAMEEADQKNANEDIRDKEGRSRQKVKKFRKRKRRTAAGRSEASKQDDKVESSQRKKVKSMGMIFMCNSKTKKDCYHYKVLGLPSNKRDMVGKVYKGMRLFLYDVDLKLLYGIYKAAGPGGYNIQPRAFNSQFPSQVRFTVLEDCLPLAEERFKKVIKDNYFTKTKFDCLLTSQQVKNLCKLFVSASKGSEAIRSAKRVKTHASTDQDRSRARGEKKRSAMAERRRYHERSRNREREAVASPVAAVPRRVLPPPTAVPSYAYDRTLELDAYRQDWVVEHRDSHRHPVPEPRLEHRIVYRRDPLLHELGSYRRDVAMEHLDLRLRDEIGRRDAYISYRERERPELRELRPRDDFVRHDPLFSYRGRTEDHNLLSREELRRGDRYMSYGELPAYRDRIYGTDTLPEHERYLPFNRSEYPSTVAPLSVYRTAPSLYRY